MLRIFRIALLTLTIAGLVGCTGYLRSEPSPPREQQEFFSELQRLCGQSFTGRAVEAPASDTLYSDRPLAMSVRDCAPHRVVIGVQVGDDHSRTWIVSHENRGLRLMHVHRYHDGTEAENSRYGGVTRTSGTPWRQDFPADAFSIQMVPGRATQTWTLELLPGDRFDYSLHRTETDLRYRFRFDLRPQQ